MAITDRPSAALAPVPDAARRFRLQPPLLRTAASPSPELGRRCCCCCELSIVPSIHSQPSRSITTELIHLRHHRAHRLRVPAAAMSYFRITLMRSAIGLPQKTRGVLAALGLRKRMRTVYHPVTQSVAGQIMRVKELVDVQEVDAALTNQEQRELRRPDPGYFIEKRS